MDNPGHLPVDTATAAPPKPILKKRDSHDCDSHNSKCLAHDAKYTENDSHENSKNRGAQWDEMNILATYHPAGKDYGHMKIDDPPTPYHEYTQELDEDAMAESTTQLSTGMSSHGSLRERKASFSDTTPEMLDSDVLAEKLADPYQPKSGKGFSSDSDGELEITEEERDKQKSFKDKRKQHYNEFQAVQLARQLLLEEEDEEDETME